MISTLSRGGLGLAAMLTTAVACSSTLEAEPVRAERSTRNADPAAAPAAPSNAKQFPFEKEAMSVADVSEKTVPSVVNIATSRRATRMSGHPGVPDEMFRRFFRGRGGPPQPELQQGRGSGVIVQSDIVLTNNHVIEGAEEVKVTLNDGREYDAEVVGADPPSDLAVIRLKNPPKSLRPLPLGDSDALRLGEIVVAIGNPFGVGQTVTMGIVSAKGRANMGIVDYEDFIQTDAAINPGNSGGALVNLEGELVGVNTAILSRTGGSQGIGFAIPSNMVRSIMNSLLENGKVERGFLGVMIQDLTSDLARAMELDIRRGVVVSEVVSGSPADKGGIEAGDVIVAVDGRAMSSSAKLRNVVASMGAGKKIDVKVVRDGKEKTLAVELEQRENAKPGAPADDDALYGMNTQALTPALAQQLGLPDRVGKGVVVTDVDPTSLAARSGLRPEDVVVAVDRKAVATPQQLAAALAKSGKTAVMRVYRGGNALFLVLKK